MRRALIVSPHFPPVNAPDHQRVRMSLPYLHEFGWLAAVLAVSHKALEGMPVDPLLESTVPRDVQVTRVGALPVPMTRAFGLGNLAMRSLPFLCREGNRRMSNRQGAKRAKCEGGKVDLVFFSTTQFPVMILGPAWKRRFGVPYVADMQDPWLDDYYERTGTPPPGGKLKYQMSRMIARQLEPRVMRGASQVIATSPSYVETLRERYPYLRPNQLTVLPFGSPEKDFKLLPTLDVEQKVFDPADGKEHWLYIGRSGYDMAPAVRLLFSQLSGLRRQNPELRRNVRLHFAGTSYATRERAEKTIEPLAREYGLDDMVNEITDRQPYFESLKALTEADALIVIGSDSPSYSASKLYPYMLARKPMLAVLHEESPAVKILRDCGAANVVTFTPGHLELSRTAMAQALQQNYEMAGCGSAPNIDEYELRKYSAREMTRKMCEVFDRALERT